MSQTNKNSHQTKFGSRLIQCLIGKSRKETDSQSGDEIAHDGASLGKGVSVFIEPDSEEMLVQSLLARSELNEAPFLIGRRLMRPDSSAEEKINFLIAQSEPFTISRRHCSIQRTQRGAFVEDLGSRTGIEVNGVRYGSLRSKERMVKLGVGEHRLVLGPRGSKICFKLTISEAGASNPASSGQTA